LAIDYKTLSPRQYFLNFYAHMKLGMTEADESHRRKSELGH